MERAVQTLKNGLKRLKEGTLSACFLFNYRQTPQTTTGTSPAQLLLGRPLRSRLDLLRPDVSRRFQGRQEKQKEAHNTHSADRELATGDLVYAGNFGRGPYWLPGRIMKQTGPISFQVQMEEEQVMWHRHQDHSGNGLSQERRKNQTLSQNSR